MIQEKDFLYRVPVKNALVTAPGQQVRNPEILVDTEGGEFMRGNILDANSTNKLVNQSVKEAVDNKIIEGGLVTKDLLEAETSARTKGDEDLSSKIKAEQTRAEGKEKEISDKLAIVNGDSNTEGSFRKAIADVVAAAPEDLDTLKEIADKLAGNDDLHTALNQVITEKADASALLNEVTRATGAESGLQAAIATKADATALSNYVLTTALNKQVDTLNAAISAKQDAGKYLPYINYGNGTFTYELDDPCKVQFSRTYGGYCYLNTVGGDSIYFKKYVYGDKDNEETVIKYSFNGITSNKYNSCLATSDGTFKPISDFVLKTELPTVPTKTSQLTNDSNFITADYADDDSYGLSVKGLKFGVENNGQLTIDADGIRSDVGEGFSLSDTGIEFNGIGVKYGRNGITSTDFPDCIPTTNGTFIEQSKFVSSEVYNEKVIALEARIAALEAKHPEAAA